MAANSTSSTIRLIFDGATKGVAAAAAATKAALAGVDDQVRKASASTGDLEKLTASLAKAQKSQAAASDAVAAASDRVAKARRAEADASGQVRVAEAALKELRDKGNASASQLAAAEERLAAAQRKGEAAVQSVATAQRAAEAASTRLASTQSKVIEAQQKLQAETDRSSSVLTKFSAALEKSEKFASKAGTSLLTVTKGIAVLGAAGSAVQVIGGVAGALAQLAPAALLLPGALLTGAAALVTFKIATAGVGDALKAGLSGDMEKFAKATKDMAPAMLAGVKAIIAFKPQIDDLKHTVQGNFWGQFSGDIKSLGDKVLPVLKAGLGGIATQMGVVVKASIAAAQTPFFTGAVADILDGTAGFFREIGSAVGDLLTGFVGLGKVGIRFLDPLGEKIGGIALQFRDWVTANSQAGGAIEKMISNALSGFGDLFFIIGNVGSILKSVFTGLGANFASPLASLKELTGQLADFLKTAEAQDGLRALGDVLQVCAQVMRDVLITALKEVAPLLVDLAPAAIALARGVGDFLVAAIRIAGPLLQSLARFLSDNADAVRVAVPFLLAAAVAIKGLLIAKTVITAVRALSTALSFLGTKAGLWGLAVVAAADIAVGAIKGYSKEQEAAFAKGGFGDDINTFVKDFKVEPLQAIGKEIRASLTPPAETQRGFKVIADSFQHDFVDVMVAAPARVKSSFQTDFIDVFARLGDSVGQFFSALPGQIGSALSTLGSTISTAATGAWNSLVTSAQTAGTTVVTFVTGLPGQIGAALSSLGASISATATSAWNSLVTATQTAIDSVVTFTTDLPFKVGFALGSLIGIIASAATNAWNSLVTATTTAVDATVAFVIALPGQIAAGLATLGGIIAAAATAAWQFLVSATTTAIDAAVAFAVALPGQIGAALASLGSTIVSIATSAWASFTAAVTAGANTAIAFVRSVPGLIGGALAALASTLSNAATTAWNAFTNAIRNAWNATSAFVRSVPGLIVGALSSLGGSLASSGSNAWNSFTNAIRNAFNATVAFVRGIPGAIVSALGNLGGLLAGAGRALMQGFLDGLRSVAASITNFVSGFVSGIRAYFPFSPAKKGAFSGQGWTLFSGQALMQGFADGIAQSSGLITSAAAAAMQAAQGVLSTPLAPPSLSMATTGLSLSAPDTTAETLRQLLAVQSESTPIEVTVLLDGQPVRDIARTEIATTSRATRRVVLAGAGTTF